MNQSIEMELRELIEAYLAKYPLHETVYIKIVDNTVKVGNTVPEVEVLQPYPRQEKKHVYEK